MLTFWDIYSRSRIDLPSFILMSLAIDNSAAPVWYRLVGRSSTTVSSETLLNETGNSIMFDHHSSQCDSASLNPSLSQQVHHGILFWRGGECYNFECCLQGHPPSKACSSTSSIRFTSKICKKKIQNKWCQPCALSSQVKVIVLCKPAILEHKHDLINQFNACNWKKEWEKLHIK